MGHTLSKLERIGTAASDPELFSNSAGPSGPSFCLFSDDGVDGGGGGDPRRSEATEDEPQAVEGREDKWTRKDRLLREATAEKRREQETAEAAADAAAEAANKEDPEAAKATRYRECWIQIFSRFHGSYEDTTSIPPMRYTDDQPPPSAGVGYADAVVIFSVKVTQLDDCLKWPLDVYGIVAARDSVDRN
ncbi:hypothetical protein ACQ4PT_024506 [Festuca glaucescens]